jgi:ATP/maltotriose-dependent transcriptional regulator MalT
MCYAQEANAHAPPSDAHSLPRRGDVGVVAQAENLLGHVEHGAGNMNAARDQFTRSVEMFQALAIPWGVGNAMTGMAAAALATGDAARAERLVEEAMSALRHAAPLFLSLALYVRAILAVRRGNADEAIAVVRESLTHIRELQDKLRSYRSRSSRAAALRATTRGRRRFWALGRSHRTAVRWWSTNHWTISMNWRQEVRASADRWAGAARAAGALSMHWGRGILRPYPAASS